MKSGCVTKKLGEVCETFNGIWKGSKPPFRNVGVIRSTNFTKECGFDSRTEKTVFIDVEEKKFLKRKLQYGDIVVERSGGGPNQPVGRVLFFNLKDGDYTISNFTSALRVRDNAELDSYYLYHALCAQYFSGVTAKMQGNSINIINLHYDEYLNLDIPIPPLSEQKRIVKKIDAAFEKIDALKANAEKNLANAKELFQSALDEAMRPKKGWVERRLGELGETLTGMTPSTKDKSNFGDYMPFVKPGDIAPFSQIQFRAEGLSQKGVGLSRLIKKDSVLMVCIGASIGKTGYADRDCTCNQQINALTPKGFSGRYLYYLLSSEKFKTKLIDESGQTTLPIISKSKWENLRVFVLEALDEQREIVKRLDFLSEKIKLLDQNYTRQIADCVEMRQAILREAFEGRL